MKTQTAHLVLSLAFVVACAPRPSAYVEVPASEFDEYQDLPGHVLAFPDEGFVPDAETAVAIAESVLRAVYGPDVLKIPTPLRVALRDEVWVIFGTLPEDWAGGVPHIEIAKADGQVLRVSHGY